MTPTFFLEAFGRLSPGTKLAGIDSEEEKDGLFHRVFEARAGLMSWSTAWDRRRRPLLWNLYDAGLTDGTDASLIGWVYGELSNSVDVGEAMAELRDLPEITEPELRELLETIPEGTKVGWATIPTPPGYEAATVEISMALPALVQCFDDALRRLGVVELSDLQVSCYNAHLGPSTRSFNGALGSRWFKTAPQASVDALIAFDNDLLEGHAEAELVASLQHRYTGPFVFGPAAAVPEQHSIKVQEQSFHSFTPAQSGLGVSVSLPEWTASAAGWVLATVIDAARAIAPDVENFAVRISQVR